jgi:hypothetical protein
MTEQDEKITFDQIIIEASPFIRTLQTAANISKCIEKSELKVQINYLFSEFQDDWVYKKNPIPELEIKNKSSEDLNKEYTL